MLLYLLRHGAAEAAAKSGRDADRALTDEGREKVRRVIRRAREGGLWPALILSSPFTRALETVSYTHLDVYKRQRRERGHSARWNRL